VHVDPEKELGALAQARQKKLQAHVKKQPAATQKEIQKVFGISHTWSGGGGDHRLYRESGRLPRGRGERIYQKPWPSTTAGKPPAS